MIITSLSEIDTASMLGALREAIDPRRLGDVLAAAEETGDPAVYAAAVPLALAVSQGEAGLTGVLSRYLGDALGPSAAILEKALWIRRFEPLGTRLAVADALLENPVPRYYMVRILRGLVEIGEHRERAEQRGIDIPRLLSLLDREAAILEKLAYTSYRPIRSPRSLAAVLAKPMGSIVFTSRLVETAVELAGHVEKGRSIVVYGEEYSGRTTLLYTVAAILIARGHSLAYPSPYAPSTAINIVDDAGLADIARLINSGRVFVAATAAREVEKLEQLLGPGVYAEHGSPEAGKARIIVYRPSRLYGPEDIEAILRKRFSCAEILYTGSYTGLAQMIVGNLENIDMLILAAKTLGEKGLGREEAEELLAGDPLEKTLHRLLLLRRKAPVAGLLLATLSRTGVAGRRHLERLAEAARLYGDPSLLLERLTGEYMVLIHPSLRRRIREVRLDKDLMDLLYELWRIVEEEQYRPAALASLPVIGGMDVEAFPLVLAMPGAREKVPLSELRWMGPWSLYREARRRGISHRIVEAVDEYLSRRKPGGLARILAETGYGAGAYDAFRGDMEAVEKIYAAGHPVGLDEKTIRKRGLREALLRLLYTEKRYRELLEETRRMHGRVHPALCAAALARNGLYLEALATAEKIPRAKTRLYLQHLAHRLRGDIASAASLLEKLLSRVRGEPHALLSYRKGIIYMYMHNYQEALRVLAQAETEIRELVDEGYLRLYPLLLNTVLAEARTYLYMGRVDDAERLLGYAEEVERECMRIGLCGGGKTRIHRLLLRPGAAGEKLGPDKPLLLLYRYMAAAARRGDFGEAEKHMRVITERIDRLAEKEPRFCDRLIDLAAYAAEKGLASAARRVLEDVDTCRGTPGHRAAHRHVEAISMLDASPRKALSLLNTCIREARSIYENKGYVNILRLLVQELYHAAKHLMRAGKPRQAEERVEEMLSLSVELMKHQPFTGMGVMLRYHRRAAAACLRIEKCDRGLAIIEKAIKRYMEAPEYLRSHYFWEHISLEELRALLLHRAGRYDEAEKILAELLRRCDVYGRYACATRISYELARVLVDKGSLRRAMETLLVAERYYRDAARRGQRVKPSLMARIQILMAHVYERIGMHDKALALLEDLWRRLAEWGLTGYRWRVRLLEARVLRRSGGYVEALRKLDEALREPGAREGRVLIEKVRLLLDMGKHRDAYKLLGYIEKKKLLPLPELLYWRLVALRRMGKEKKYRKELEKTLQRLGGEGGGIYSGRIMMLYTEQLLREERLGEAIDVAREALARPLDPETRVRLLYVAARAYRGKGDLGEAYRFLTEAAREAERLAYEGYHRVLQLLLSIYEEGIHVTAQMRRDIAEKWRRRLCGFLDTYVKKWYGTRYAEIAGESLRSHCSGKY